MSITITIYY